MALANFIVRAFDCRFRDRGRRLLFFESVSLSSAGVVSSGGCSDVSGSTVSVSLVVSSVFSVDVGSISLDDAVVVSLSEL